MSGSVDLHFKAFELYNAARNLIIKPVTECYDDLQDSVLDSDNYSQFVKVATGF